jgi:hypothetical protein
MATISPDDFGTVAGHLVAPPRLAPGLADRLADDG